MNRFIFIIMLSVSIFAMNAWSEFGDTSKRALHLSVDGDRDRQAVVVSGVLPLKFMDGYIGGETRIEHKADWIHDTRLRIEGGYSSDRVGIRGYGRYGRVNVMGIGSLYHVGAYGFVYLHKSDNSEVTAGLGTWAQHTVLSDILRFYPESGLDLKDDAGIDLGPRVHLEVQLGAFSVLTEFMPNLRFKTFTLRVLPAYRQKIWKNLYYLVTAGFDYRSTSHHRFAENWSGNFIHKAVWEFD